MTVIVCQKEKSFKLPDAMNECVVPKQKPQGYFWLENDKLNQGEEFFCFVLEASDRLSLLLLYMDGLFAFFVLHRLFNKTKRIPKRKQQIARSDRCKKSVLTQSLLVPFVASPPAEFETK